MSYVSSVLTRKSSSLATVLTNGYTVYSKLNISLGTLFFFGLFYFSAALPALLVSYFSSVMARLVAIGGSPCFYDLELTEAPSLSSDATLHGPS